MPGQVPTVLEMHLLALVVSKKAGREIAKCYEKETGKSISYGSLYTTFRRLKEAGWVRVEEGEDEDGRIRYFQITGHGVKALENGREFYRSVANFGRRILEVTR